MNKKAKLIVVLTVLLVVAAALALKQGGQDPVAEARQAPAAPRLVDLGADKCIPCKMMAPILEELEKEYQDKAAILFVDVWENPDAGAKYGIKLIPTQIFYNAEGKEVLRHEGFLDKATIVNELQKLGVK